MSDPMTITVRYYAVFREQAGRSGETLQVEPGDAATLYADLTARHGFGLPLSLVRVAVNRTFCPMDTRLSPGDEVVFIPPVAGG